MFSQKPHFSQIVKQKYFYNQNMDPRILPPFNFPNFRVNALNPGDDDDCRNIRLLSDSAERKACIDDLVTILGISFSAKKSFGHFF
jgi:hypothetical protein